tara:strand:+ start:1852 stop:2253 length:402 start_codon:yes stop_codon:yes gene_type:complete
VYSTHAFCAATCIGAFSSLSAWSTYKNGGATTTSTLSPTSPPFNASMSAVTEARSPLHFQFPPTMNRPVPSLTICRAPRSRALRADPRRRLVSAARDRAGAHIPRVSEGEARPIIADGECAASARFLRLNIEG